MEILRPAVPPGTEADAYRFYRRLDPRAPWLRLNMVASLDGEIADPTGRAGGLGGAGDLNAFRAQRALADAVLVGAGTARVEGYGPHRAHGAFASRRRADGWTTPAAMVVVSQSLQLDPGSPLFTDAATRTVIVTSASSPSQGRRRLESVADLIVAGDECVDFALALVRLRERGLHAILCEGGPQLNAALFAAGLVDELCLTVSPMILVRDATRLVASSGVPVHGLALEGIAREGDELFLRYRVTRGGR